MNIYLEKFIKEKISKPGTALDFGCGNGYDVACLKAIGWQAIGLDKKALSKDCTVWDLETPFKSPVKYDLVFSNYVLPFITNKKGFIKNMYDCLANGGWAFLSTFSKADNLFGGKGTDKNELTELFKEFKIVEISEDDFFDNEPGHKHWHKLLNIAAKK